MAFLKFNSDSYGMRGQSAPQVNTYQRQVAPGGQIRGGVSAGPGLVAGQVIDSGGEVMKGQSQGRDLRGLARGFEAVGQAAEREIYARDETRYAEAVTAFNERKRLFMLGQSERKGSAALDQPDGQKGIMAATDEFYSANFNEMPRFETRRVGEQYQAQLAMDRQRGLEEARRLQVREEGLWKESVFDGQLMNLEKDIQQTPLAWSLAAEDALTLWERQNPGLDSTAMRHELTAKYAKAGIYGAAASGDMATAEKILGEAGGVIGAEERVKLQEVFDEAARDGQFNVFIKDALPMIQDGKTADVLRSADELFGQGKIDYPQWEKMRREALSIDSNQNKQLEAERKVQKKELEANLLNLERSGSLTTTKVDEAWASGLLTADDARGWYKSATGEAGLMGDMRKRDKEAKENILYTAIQSGAIDRNSIGDWIALNDPNRDWFKSADLERFNDWIDGADGRINKEITSFVALNSKVLKKPEDKERFKIAAFNALREVGSDPQNKVDMQSMLGALLADDVYKNESPELGLSEYSTDTDVREKLTVHKMAAEGYLDTPSNRVRAWQSMESGKPMREIPAPDAAEWDGKGIMNRPLGRNIYRYKGVFEKAGQDYNIDPNLLAAMAFVESRGNPKAVSQAGAQGLMQFMPGTAAAMGLKDPFDPEQSIMAAAKYMRQILDSNGGDMDMAIAGYNWGPNRGVLKDGSGRGMPKETRKYLVEVNRYYSGAAGYYSDDVRINPNAYLGGYPKANEVSAPYSAAAQGE